MRVLLNAHRLSLQAVRLRNLHRKLESSDTAPTHESGETGALCVACVDEIARLIVHAAVVLEPYDGSPLPIGDVAPGTTLRIIDTPLLKVRAIAIVTCCVCVCTRSLCCLDGDMLCTYPGAGVRSRAQDERLHTRAPSAREPLRHTRDADALHWCVSGVRGLLCGLRCDVVRLRAVGQTQPSVEVRHAHVRCVCV
jgi:hypothetical protein